ncbi:MAG: hypothetical protein AVDCRST_MAG02-22, partial [uncultured Rubrobacteraceae bacterium]
GRLALREGRELDRTRRGAREVRRGLQRPGPLRARGARRRAPIAGGGFGFRLRGQAPRGRAEARLLLCALRQGPGFFGLHPLPALAGLRGGGTGGEGGRAVAGLREPHRRARRRAALALRGEGRGRHRGTAVGRAPEALRELVRATAVAAAALRAGRPGRRRVAEGPQVGRICSEGAATAASPPAGTLPLRGSTV